MSLRIVTFRRAGELRAREIARDIATKKHKRHKRLGKAFCALCAFWWLLAVGFSADSAVVHVAGEFAWQFEVVVNDVFEVDAGGSRVGK